MVIVINGRTVDLEFIRRVQEISGQNIHRCMQCGTCSASCPMVSGMSIPPRSIVHLLQMGLADEVGKANTPWLCASCHTCQARCPRSIDLTRVMEAVRLLTLRANQDRIQLNRLPVETLADAPQIAMVSCFRKLTA